jgi:hypothetical protein
MSWVNIGDLAVPPTVEEIELQEEEPADPKDKFWEEVDYHPDTVGYYQGFHTEVCRFDEQGNHTQMAKNCPHFEAADEEGPRIRQGWTVQQGR